MIKSLLTGAQLSDVRKLYDSPIVKELCDVIELLQTVCDAQKDRMAALISERDLLRADQKCVIPDLINERSVLQKRVDSLEEVLKVLKNAKTGFLSISDPVLKQWIDNACEVLGDKSYTG